MIEFSVGDEVSYKGKVYTVVNQYGLIVTMKSDTGYFIRVPVRRLKRVAP